jgi:trehalose 6-phosphate synthase
VPVAFGDDATDEGMFEAVNAAGGLSIKVGQEETAADWRLDRPAEVRAALRGWLDAQTGGGMSGRLIVVSNRIPTEEVPSGGLVVALHEALSETGGLWIGRIPTGRGPRRTGSSTCPATATQEGLPPDRGGAADLLPRLRELGPLAALPPPQRPHPVRARLRRGLSRGQPPRRPRGGALPGPDDLIWIHDYHFLPLAAMLRGQGVTARIGLFLHIPFPVLADLDALPEREDFPGWIAAFDVVGLQTEADVARCRELFRSEPGGEPLSGGGSAIATGRFLACAIPHRDRRGRLREERPRWAGASTSSISGRARTS